MPKASDDDGMTREEKAQHAAAKKALAAAVKKFKASKKTDEDRGELGEVVVKYTRVLTSEETKTARKLSDTFRKGGRYTRRHRRSRHHTRRY